MTAETSLGITIKLTVTAMDVREPIFAYYHKIEESPENREAEWHGQPLVTKTFRDNGKYWVTLSFPDLPDIYCLDESHGRLKGMSLEKAIEKLGEHGRIAWGHEHFITAIWEGIQVLDFKKSYQRLKEILGDLSARAQAGKFSEDPQWKAFGPTPETLEEIARALK
ncbi:MAG: hypothetical protein ACE5JU_21670 [Candidatus Binatia bacterium]